MHRGGFLTTLGSLVLAPAALAGAAAATPPLPETVDAVASLIDYLQASQTIGDALEPARFLHFRAEIVPRSFAAQGADLSDATAQFLRRWIRLIHPARERMAGLRADLLSTMATKRSTFEERFPRGLPDYTTYLSASGLTFDAVAYSKDGYRLIFGIDKLAVEAVTADHLALVAHHEMFHLLHSAANRDFANGLLQKSVAEALWFEGLACYASSLLHPGASLEDVIGVAPARRPDARALEYVRARLGVRRAVEIARLFGLEDSDGSSMPLGTGYLLGYELVRRYCTQRDMDPAVAVLATGSHAADILGDQLAGLIREDVTL